jgi:U3 small nucleolar RNA-associated protein 6
MELAYLNKLKAQTVALGGENENVFHDYDMFLGDEKGNGVGQMSILWNQRRKGICDKHLRKLQTIYSVAVEALPCSFGLRKRL